MNKTQQNPKSKYQLSPKIYLLIAVGVALSLWPIFGQIIDVGINQSRPPFIPLAPLLEGSDRWLIWLAWALGSGLLGSASYFHKYLSQKDKRTAALTGAKMFALVFVANVVLFVVVGHQIWWSIWRGLGH